MKMFQSIFLAIYQLGWIDKSSVCFIFNAMNNTNIVLTKRRGAGACFVY